MKTLKFTAPRAQAVALLAASLTCAVSATPAMASSTFESFTEDSSLNLNLRNYYHRRSHAKDNSDPTQKSWAQAARLDFNSGLIDNIIGIDALAYYNLKLYGPSDRGGLGTLKGISYSDGGGKQESHGKVGLAVKLNAADLAQLKVGRQFLSAPLLNDSDSRNLPSLTDAGLLTANLGKTDVYLIHARSGQAKTSSGSTRYTKGVNTGGLAADLGLLDFGLHYARQKNHASAIYGSASADLDLVSVSLAVSRSSAEGAAKAAAAGMEDSIDTFDLGLSSNFGGLGLAAYMHRVEKQTYAQSYALPGWSGGQDDTGYWGYNSIQYSDFNAVGQNSYQLRGDYDFGNGFKVMARYVYGTTKSDATQSGLKAKEKEFNTNLSYAIQNGSAKGVNFLLRVARNNRKNFAVADSETQLTDVRFITNYTLSVF